MAAHKTRAIGRTEDGADVTMFFETIASQVKCTVSDETAGGDIGEGGGQTATQIGLDELLNQYADEINNNTAAIVEHGAQLQLVTSTNYAECNTPGNVAAKVVDVSPFVLGIGEEVTVKFVNINTTTAATLNVSGSGAKPILYKRHPLQGSPLTGVQKFSYDGENWNVIGDFDTDTDTTYDLMDVSEAAAGSEIVPRTINALTLNQTITQISADIVNASLADSYDVSGLQASLNNLIFQLAANGVIDGDGLDTVVTLDSASDVVLVSGMYANGRVYI